MPTYVIGHKNPDTDAICSAIGYADLLRRTGMPEAEAARCGELNARTAFALEQAGVPAPKLVMDVRPTAGQMAHRAVISAGVDESFGEVFDRMRGPGLRTLPVLDASGHVLGMLSLQKMVDQLLPDSSKDPTEARIVDTNLRRMVKALGGKFQNEVDIDEEVPFILTVGAQRAAAFGERLGEFPLERTILVTGNRPTIQKPAIDFGVRALIVTSGYEIEPNLLAQAKAKGVAVIVSPHDTATTTILIKCSKRVTHALQKDFVRFAPTDPIEKIRAMAATTGITLFPVVDENDKLVGVFSKSDLVYPPLTKLILVDHNEFGQAVNGVEQAEVLEVLDHHRLGGNLVTREPIRFINEPLGSTCSIVTKMFLQRGLIPSPEIALCLATGLISDTLYLTSPTTTAEDKELLVFLGKAAQRDLKEYAERFFAAGSVLQVHSAAEVVRGDCKEFKEAGWKFAIAQVEELGLERFWERRAELQQALENLAKEKGMDFACLFITDITRHVSVMLAAGHARVLEAIDYPRLDGGVFQLEGVVSRKKQLLPHLIGLLQGMTK